jgi:hypothetical protein
MLVLALAALLTDDVNPPPPRPLPFRDTAGFAPTGATSEAADVAAAAAAADVTRPFSLKHRERKSSLFKKT